MEIGECTLPATKRPSPGQMPFFAMRHTKIASSPMRQFKWKPPVASKRTIQMATFNIYKHPEDDSLEVILGLRSLNEYGIAGMGLGIQ
jgi:hypothetical protein